jgi:hypothetical protein
VRTHQNPPEDVVLALREEDDDLVLFCEVDGKPIAKRYSGESWLILEPGWTVLGGGPGNYGTIELIYDPDDEPCLEVDIGALTYGRGAAHRGE